LGFVATSEPVVRFAWATGLLCVALSAALVLQVLRMRRRLARRERRREAVVAAWRPVLFEVVAGGSPQLPPIAPDEEDAFLLLWLQVQDAIRGPQLARLAAVGEAVGARSLAQRRIRGADAVGRTLALRTLGYLRHPEDRAPVLRWLSDPRAYVSLAAARALVHLDPEGSPDDILPRLATRADWPVPLFASVLEGASRSRLSTRFRALCRELPAELLVRMLPLAALVDAPVVDALLADLLDPEGDPEVLAAALRHVRGPALLPAVRRAAVHERWSVRVQAAAALGRVGEPSDTELLLELTRDREWWVRYRAAQALAAGPFAAPEEIVQRAARLRDRFARDMVQQVLAEARA
jgi:HEAT repeat protein